METTSDTRVTIRVDKSLKENAERLFDRLGMNVSVAVNVFLRKAVEEQAIPFEVSTKSTGFIRGYTADEILAGFQDAVTRKIADAEYNGEPVAKYDAKQNRAYLQYSDGKREYIGDEQ